MLERTLEREIELMHHVQLNKFRRIQMSLQPFGHLQERTWNIWYYLNEYGFDFIPDLLKQPFFLERFPFVYPPVNDSLQPKLLLWRDVAHLRGKLSIHLFHKKILQVSRIFSLYGIDCKITVCPLD
ncbi:hypothetical protein GCM10020331_045430 [Ectobacillus funiculus]